MGPPDPGRAKKQAESIAEEEGNRKEIPSESGTSVLNESA